MLGYRLMQLLTLQHIRYFLYAYRSILQGAFFFMCTYTRLKPHCLIETETTLQNNSVQP